MPSEQTFKAVYFSDYKNDVSSARGVVLAFGEKNLDLYHAVAELSSSELRAKLGTDSFYELGQRARAEGLPVNTYCLWYLRKNFEIATDNEARQESTTPKEIETFVNRVIEGDCVEVMRDIPDQSIDMILCDLPYGTTQNKWDSIIPLDKLWEHYERVIKPTGAIVLTAQGLFTAQLMLSNPGLFKYKVVWEKSKPTNFLNAKKQPLRKHEDVCVFYKKQPLYTPQMSAGEPYNKGFRKNQLTGSYGDFKTVEVKSSGERYPTDVVYFKTAESEGEVFHPTQKPVELGRYFIKTFTRPDDIVLDNTCGSGSFLVSAVLEGRRFIGIEKNEEVYLHKKHATNYIAICEKRIRDAKREFKSRLF